MNHFFRKLTAGVMAGLMLAGSSAAMAEGAVNDVPLRKVETAVTDALAAVQSAREKFEALSAPEKKETPQPELPEEPAEAEAAEETAEETVDNA